MCNLYFSTTESSTVGRQQTFKKGLTASRRLESLHSWRHYASEFESHNQLSSTFFALLSNPTKCSQRWWKCTTATFSYCLEKYQKMKCNNKGHFTLWKKNISGLSMQSWQQQQPASCFAPGQKSPCDHTLFTMKLNEAWSQQRSLYYCCTTTKKGLLSIKKGHFLLVVVSCSFPPLAPSLLGHESRSCLALLS